MKLYSRSTFGIIVGGANILLYVAASIMVMGLISIRVSDRTNATVHINQGLMRIDKTIQTFGDVKENPEVASSIIMENIVWTSFLLSTALSVCLVLITMNVFLIIGIVKRLHRYILPWLVLSGIAFVCGLFRILFAMIIGPVYGMSDEQVTALLIASVLEACIQGFVFWPMYRLFEDIMAKNNKKSIQFANGVQYKYVAPEAPPQYNYYESTLPQKS